MGVRDKTDHTAVREGAGKLRQKPHETYVSGTALGHVSNLRSEGTSVAQVTATPAKKAILSSFDREKANSDSNSRLSNLEKSPLVTA